MEYARHLDATVEEFFDEMARTVKRSIQHETGKEVPTSRLDGYRYARIEQDGRKLVRGKTRVGFKPPRTIELKHTWPEGVKTIRYVVEPADEGGIEVTFCESFRPKDKTRGVLSGLSDRVYEWDMKRNAKKALRSIERNIQISRGRIS